MSDILGIPPDEILFAIEDRDKTRYYSSLHKLFQGMAQGYGWTRQWEKSKPSPIRVYFSPSSLALMGEEDRATLVRTVEAIIKWPFPASGRARAQNLAWAENSAASRRAFVDEARRVLETEMRK